VIRELAIVSGKGGTGKTSLAASLAVLAGKAVIADCDVDASDLPLVLGPCVRERHEFWSGREAVIRREDCLGCGACSAHCRFGAVLRRSDEGEGGTKAGTPADCESCDYCKRSCSLRTNAMIREMMDARGDIRSAEYAIDPLACEGCAVCVRFCPAGAIDFRERLCGEWMVSDTRCGPMVHARLGIAAENSGKLVSTVRREARRIAEERRKSLVIVDGPPGIGCPVIASVTGAARALVVTEPTVSGEHDLERILSLTRHFGIATDVCVNKWDLNVEMAERIEGRACRAGARVAGRVRYDSAVTAAQIRERAVVETDAPSAGDIRQLWVGLGLGEA
jgi:MinD superfamily P-loop ATPase